MTGSGIPKNRDVYSYIEYVQGALLACDGEPEKGYSMLMDSIQTEPETVTPEFAVPAGNREFALGWISLKRQRPMESAVWYRKPWNAVIASEPEGFIWYSSNIPNALKCFPTNCESFSSCAKASATKVETAPAAFVRLLAEAKASESREATLAAERRRDEQIGQLQLLAAEYQGLAHVYQAEGRRDDYRKLLNKAFETHGQQVGLKLSDWQLKRSQGKVAAELARSYLEAKETQASVLWITRAADLGDTGSLIQLSDWYEKGTNVKADASKAEQYGYLGHYQRGTGSLSTGLYEEALADLKKVCGSQRADADDFDKLGQCYARLNRWDEAIKAYTRSLDLDIKSQNAAVVVFNLLEAFVAAERPGELLQFVQILEKKGWKRPAAGSDADKYGALFHGYQAIALRMTGKDASDAERMMREYTGKPTFKTAGWTGYELNRWLKASKLEPDRKAAVQRIIIELSGAPNPYTFHNTQGIQLFRERRYQDALPELTIACESPQANAVDHNRLAMCYGKLDRWDEAVKEYTCSIELDLKSEDAIGHICNLLEALICADRPEQLLQFVQAIEKKGWKLPKGDTEPAKYGALFHGFQAIALSMTGKDASEPLGAMRQLTSKAGFKVTDWTWDELNNWLKATKLARTVRQPWRRSSPSCKD